MFLWLAKMATHFMICVAIGMKCTENGQWLHTNLNPALIMDDSIVPSSAEIRERPADISNFNDQFVLSTLCIRTFSKSSS